MQSLQPRRRGLLRIPPPPPPFPINSQLDYYLFDDLENSDSDSDIDFWWDAPASPPLPFPILSGEDFAEANGNTSDSSLASCPICRDDLHAPDTTMQHLPCTHVYHRHCIMLWLQDKNTCPVCRFQILSDDLDLLFSNSLAGSAHSLQQHLPIQSFSSTILHERLLLPPPPPPPLPGRPPFPYLPPILLRNLRTPEFWHQSATTPSPFITPHTEAETAIQPSAPVLSTTTEESLPILSANGNTSDSGEDFSEANGNTSDSSLASCPICREDLHAPNTTMQHLPCTHVYHRHCIMLWLQDKNTCPVCRFQILSDDLDLLFSSSLAGSAHSLQQHLPIQSFSSTILHERLLLPPPPPPPLPGRPPFPYLPPILLRNLRTPEFWHQSATTPSPLITPHIEAETTIQPSAPVLSTTTEESLPSPQTQLQPDSPAISTVRDDEIHSVSQRGFNGRFRKVLYSFSCCIGRSLRRHTRCIGRS